MSLLRWVQGLYSLLLSKHQHGVSLNMFWVKSILLHIAPLI